MPYRIRIEPKSVPVDEAHLLSEMERLGRILGQYRRQLLIGLLVLLLAVAIVGVVLWLDHRNAEQALALDQQATRLYFDRPLDKPEKANENLKQAVALYRQLVERYPRSPSAPLALFHLGNALMQMNDLGGAVEAYQRYVATYGASNKMLLGLVYQRLGYAYLLKGDFGQAEKALTAVLALPGALNKDQALFELGKLEEAQSRPEGALARYQELAKDYPNSPFTGEASVRIKALEAKKNPVAPAEEGHAGPAPQTGQMERKPSDGGK